MYKIEFDLKVTHIGVVPLVEDQQFEHGPILAHVDGNRVVLTRRHRLGRYPVISDEIIPDEYLSLVLVSLRPV